MIDQVYAQVVLRFKQLNYVNLNYSAVRTILAAFFLADDGQHSAGMEAWLLLAVAQGVVAFAYYYLLIEHTRSNEVVVLLGAELYHTYNIGRQELAERGLPVPDMQRFDSLVFPTFDFNSPGEEESRASYTVLMLQLQFEVNRLTKALQLLSVFQFSMFYSLQIFGVFLYLGEEVPRGTWLELFFKAFMIIALYLFI
jgi:hypothetical protein